MTSADLRPHSGARFELDLLMEEDGGARYQARLYLPDGRYDYALHLSGSGQPTLLETDREPTGGEDRKEPPLWATTHLLALGRMLYREAGREGAFKRRLLRWRDKDPG